MRYIKVMIEAGNGEKVYLQETHYQGFETKAQQLAEQVPIFWGVMKTIEKQIAEATEIAVAEVNAS